MSKFDGFIDEVQANNNPHRRRGCGFGAMLNDLPGEDADQVEKVMNDPKYTTAAIVAALRTRIDDAPSVFTVSRHRRRMCGCFGNTRGAELK